MAAKTAAIWSHGFVNGCIENVTGFHRIVLWVNAEDFAWSEMPLMCAVS
jgi:hypothetical protein